MNIRYNDIIIKDKLNILKEKTNNFTKIPYQIFLEDSSYITILRIIIGYTIHQFSKEIKISYPWIYDLEHKKAKIGERGAKNIANKIEDLFKKLNLINNVKTEEVYLNYKTLNNIKIESNISKSLEDLSNKSFEEFLNLYKNLKKETKNFSYFPSSILIKDSKIILVLRIILGLTQKEFAKEAEIANMTVEELENGYRKIKWPVTARRYSQKIQEILKNKYKEIDIKELERRWDRWKNTRKQKEKIILNWKNIKKIGVKDFLQYFKKTKRKTKNFTQFNPELFQKNPQIIIILRIILGLTQKDLEREIGLHKKGNISDYENMYYQTLNRGRAEMFSNFFSRKIKDNIDEKEAINKFVYVKEKMYCYRKSIFDNLKSFPLTEQEKLLVKEFKKERRIYKNLNIHENIDTGKGTVNVDFLINNKDKPIIIEATKFYDSKSKRFANNWRQRIFLLDHRFIKIKQKFPKALTFLFIELENNPQLEYRLKKFTKEQTIACDDTFINGEFKKINNKIMEEIR